MFLRLNKDFGGTATKLRLFTDTGWSNFAEGKAGGG